MPPAAARRTTLLILALAVLCGLCAPSAPAASSASQSTGAASFEVDVRAKAAPEEVGEAITLVTGDLVRLFQRGRNTGYTLTSPDGTKGSARAVTGIDGSIRVVPNRVAELVGEILDPRLFEVTTIADAGLTDDQVAGLPLVVEVEPGASPTLPGLGRLVPVPGSTTVRTTLDRASAAELGDALLAGDGAGVRAIRLDLPVDAGSIGGPLQESVPLVALTVHVRNRTGERLVTGERAWVDWNNIDDPEVSSPYEHVSPGEDGFVLQVEPGRYALSLLLEIETADRDLEAVKVDLPEVVVDGPTEVVLDASTANEITVDVGAPARTQELCLYTYRENEAGQRVLAVDGCLFRIYGATRAFVAPTALPTDGSYEFSSRIALAGRERWYDLVFPHIGRVPDDPSEVVGPEDVAELRESFAVPRDESSGIGRFAFQASKFGSFLFGYSFDGPTRSVDWLSAGAVTWQENSAGLMTRTRSVEAGSSRRVRWSGQPLRPASTSVSERSGNLMVWRVANWVDTDRHYRLPGRSYRRMFVLEADGRVIAKKRDAYRWLRVPDGAATFVGRLTSRGIGESPVSRELDTTWTFDSETTGSAEPLPLLVVDYRLGADLEDQAPHPTPIELGVRHEAREIRTAIASCTLSASIDGGRTWHPVELTETEPGRFAGTIDVPGAEPGDAVSLLVGAADAGSSSIAQEITAAYLIGAPARLP